MRFKLGISYLLIIIVSSTSCHVKNPVDSERELKEKREEQIKKNKETLDEMFKSSDEMLKSSRMGGLPGDIKISGAILQGDSSLDNRVTIITKGGIGKDGTELKIPDYKIQDFQIATDNIDLTGLTKDKKLVAIGCSEELALQLAGERALELKKPPNSIDGVILFIQAHTIVICGNADNLNFDENILFSDELILSQTDFTHIRNGGTSILSTNKLLLLGANRIQLRAVDSSMTIGRGPSIELTVLKEILSDSEGKLLLISIGSSYKEKAAE